LQELVYVNWQITTDEVAYEMCISYGSAQTILKEKVWMRRFCAIFVLRLLTDYQMECFKIIASGLFDKSTQDGVLLGKVLQEMKVRYSLMTLKPNDSHLNDSPHCALV
jgi:hypothetical protein